MRRSSVTLNDVYRGYCIDNCHGGCFVTMLDRLIDLTEYMNCNYARIFAFRFDVHFPQMYTVPRDNCVEEFLRRFAQHFRRHGIALEYLWTREQNIPARHHYHVIAFVNGDLKISADEFMEKAVAEWSRTLGVEDVGLVNLCARHNVEDEKGAFRRPEQGLMIEGGGFCNLRRERLARLIFWASYICKTHGKEMVPAGIRKWDSSRPWLSSN